MKNLYLTVKLTFDCDIPETKKAIQAVVCDTVCELKCLEFSQESTGAKTAVGVRMAAVKATGHD